MSHLVVVLVAGGALPANSTAGQVTGYEPLANWDELPRAKTDTVVGMASSFDRTGGNSDSNNYEFPEGRQSGDVDTVVTTLSGPGVITRFWMPHACADEAFPVKITIDGALRIDTDSDTLLGGGFGYMSGPLVQTLIGGQVSYEPIAFQQSIKIESANYASGAWARRHHYYQYSYRLFGEGQAVVPYSGTLNPAQLSARAAAANILSNCGANPAGADPAAIQVSRGASAVPPGGTMTLADVAGAGRVRSLNLKMGGAGDAELDGLRLRIRYDGSGEPAIDVPVSHFFGAGHQRAAYRSLPMGTDGPGGFYCYWPMPFRRGLTVELHNTTGAAISIESATVEYTTGGVDDEDGYLHATFNEQTLGAGDGHHRLLSVSGRGHYVGNLLYVFRNGTSRSFLEGDDIITVDGSQVLYGTGLEDAYNGGYYYNHVLVQDDDGDVPVPESGTGPLHGLLHMDDAELGDDFVRTDQYRWLIADAVPFTQGIEVLQEHYFNGTEALFGSTAFYYLIPAPPATGDANFDGTVGIADLGALADHYGMTEAVWMDGDFNQDGRVGIADLGALADHYGQGATGQAGRRADVPEPAGLLVLTLAAAGMVLRRAGRSRRRRA